MFVAIFWKANKKHLCTNIVSSAELWCLWKSRNRICFQGLIMYVQKNAFEWMKKKMEEKYVEKGTWAGKSSRPKQVGCLPSSSIFFLSSTLLL
jgi:hypothetical protein